MKAIVYERYGPPEVLELRELDRPAIEDEDVLVRVRAVALTKGDWHMLTCTWFAVRLFQGMFKPKRKVLGFDVAGTIEAVGAKAARFEPGDEVFGSTDHMGCFAEYARLPETGVARKPAGLRYEEAAAIPTGALTALQGLRDHGKIRAGQSVLINGASGGVGLFAVQIAKSFGAEVTGVCSAPKLDLVRSVGADHVVDYRGQDFLERDERYDLLLDNVGDRPLADCKGALARGGIYVAVSGSPMRSLWVGLAGGKNAISFVSKPNHADLDFLRGLVEDGKLKPVVDRTYPLDEAVAAFRYFGEGNARGKVVLTV